MFSTAEKDLGFIRMMERQRIVNPHMCQLLIDWNEHVVTVISKLMEPHGKRIAHKDITGAIRYTHGILRGALIWAILPVAPINPPFDLHTEEFRRRAYEMAAAYLGLDPHFED